MVFSNVTLRVAATGAPPLSYQWKKDGSILSDGGNVSGANTPGLTISLPQLADSGEYQVIVTDQSGSVSTNASLTVVPVYAWGDSPITPPANATNFMTIATGGSILHANFGVHADGTVVGWGWNEMMDIPADATNVIEVIAGYDQAIAIRHDGTATTWGMGGSTVPAIATNVVAAAIQNYTGCLALRQDGSIVAWNGATAPPPNVTNMIAIAAGAWGSAVGIRQDGTFISWGANDYGQGSPPAEATNVIALACGDRHTLALRADGVIIGFGMTGTHTTPPPDATNIVAIAAGQEISLALRADGKAIGFGNVASAPPFLTNCVAIDACYAHNLALVQDPSVRVPPVLIQQPLGGIAQPGSTFILLSRVAGSQPMAYSWMLNGSLLPDQTNRFLLLSPFQTVQGGAYQI
ncbi:MAG TPA: hypothetical protein VHH88_11820, partial [Verrucomicrobiae bacterium]|nr:hypothetical protein [Verrucomicrobiae bacterium]